MSTPVSPSRTERRRGQRRAGRLAVLATAPALALLAAPVHADVPEGWGGETTTYKLDGLHALGVYLGAPLLLFVIITLLVFLPAMVRGEKLLPDHEKARDGQWIGGPRQGVAELPAPDGEDSRAGGASGGW